MFQTGGTESVNLAKTLGGSGRNIQKRKQVPGTTRRARGPFVPSKQSITIGYWLRSLIVVDFHLISCFAFAG